MWFVSANTYKYLQSIYARVRMIINGKWVYVNQHAYEGMNCEVPPIRTTDLRETLTNPDRIQGDRYAKWIGRRTIIAYVTECEDRIEVRGVSATRRKLV